MPAWPGGPCPKCGEDMPANLVHCQMCRALLNDDFDLSSVEIPTFVPLQEIATMFDVEPAGYYIACPSCHEELRINRKYVGQHVQCKHCHAPFDFTPAALNGRYYVYADCPHCSEELRAAQKYIGQRVACKHCGGQIRLIEV